MYRTTIQFLNQELEGTLDFWVLFKVQQELKKLGRHLTIPQLLQEMGHEVTTSNMQCLFLILLCSLERGSGLKVAEIERLHDEHYNQYDTVEWKVSCYLNRFQYIQELVACCFEMKEIDEEESEFEDIPLSTKKDWDFAWMEYQWTHLLGRQDDFWRVTPKNFTQQVAAHEKFHGINKPKVEVL